MPLTANNAKNIIVGAGTVYLGKTTGTELTEDQIFTGATIQDSKAKGPVSNVANVNIDATKWSNVGYTSEGVDLSFEPDYGEVQVDQLLDVARIFKQGQKVMLNTSFTEGTLENFLITIGGGDVDNTYSSSGIRAAKLDAGSLGAAPVERSILVAGPAPVFSTLGTGEKAERLYLGYRALSMDTVGVAVKRDTATVFPVSFRLLANSTSGLYGKVIDRVYTGTGL